MSSTPNDTFAILGSLGIILCCGLPLLIFAAVTFFAARRHTRNLEQIRSAIPTQISTLKPAERLVRLEGTIRQVPHPLDGPPEAPLAFTRLRVERYESDSEDSGWRGAGDKLRLTHFLLEDESGSIWVDPQGLDKGSLGEGIIPPSLESAEATAILVGINPTVLHGQSRAWQWELRGGQRITVIGTVTNREGHLVVGKLNKEPFVVTSLLGNAVQVQSQQQAKTGWGMTALLGIPGLLAVLCGGVSALVALVRILQK